MDYYFCKVVSYVDVVAMAVRTEVVAVCIISSDYRLFVHSLRYVELKKPPSLAQLEQVLNGKTAEILTTIK